MVGINALAAEFVSDRDAGYPASGREHKYPILQEGFSAFRSEELARRRWRGMRKNATQHGELEVAKGSFIAELELIPDAGFFIEDLQESGGHLTIWGDPTSLAETVRRIFPAVVSPEKGES